MSKRGPAPYRGLVYSLGMQGKKTGGRKKGVPNKAHAHAREAIALFVERNAPRLAELIQRIEKEEGPLAAFKCIESMIEYHIPRLARTEHTGANEGPVEMIVKWNDSK